MCLTQAVIEGRKRQTRQIVPQSLIDKYEEWYDDVCCIARPAGSTIETLRNWLLRKHTRYRVGEVVAVAQSYRDCGGLDEKGIPRWNIIEQVAGAISAGWDNKMFVKSELMPHQIRITDVRVERLQDITGECCLKEGVYEDGGDDAFIPHYFYNYENSGYDGFDLPQMAYADLINRISGKGTWESNPYVFVYDFELVR